LIRNKTIFDFLEFFLFLFLHQSEGFIERPRIKFYKRENYCNYAISGCYSNEFRALTHYMNVTYVVDHERAGFCFSILHFNILK
jgi:hypothetical protein